MNLLMWREIQVDVSTAFLPSFSVDPEPHHMVLESHVACDGDGMGNGVSSNNLLASLFPGANKI
jgi:hypothetical protein